MPMVPRPQPFRCDFVAVDPTEIVLEFLFGQLLHLVLVAQLLVVKDITDFTDTVRQQVWG